MSYLNDPRVYYAIERTYLSWVRTQLSILALALLIKKFGIQEVLEGEPHRTASSALLGMCLLVVAMSVVSLWQARVFVGRLGPEEIPAPSAPRVLYTTGFLAITLNIAICIIVAVI